MAKKPYRRMTHRTTSFEGLTNKERNKIVHYFMTRNRKAIGKGVPARVIAGNLALILHEARRKHRKLKQRYASAKAAARARYHKRRHPKSRRHRKGRR